MASGLSMASVNKIKELAAAEQYDMAAPILDTQELEKSLNPQFIRICGEVYEHVGRIKDARRFYIRSHIMAPESNRIIFAIISFYLKIGYRTLAKQYLKQYVQNDADNQRNISNVNYIVDKAEGKDPESLYEVLYPYYAENIDPEWSYELYLLAKISGKTEVAEHLGNDYIATFKDSHKGEVVESIHSGRESADAYFYIYAKEEVLDKDPEYDEIREMEKKQLEADFKRLNPDPDEVEEPQFLSMVEDEFDIPDKDEEEAPKDKKEKKGLFGRLRRLKNEKDLLSDEEEGSDVVSEDEAENSGTSENSEAKPAEETTENSEQEASEENDIELTEAVSEPEEEEEPVFDDDDETEDSYTPKSIDDIITYDYDDGFAPESDTIEGLSEAEDMLLIQNYDIDELQSHYEAERSRIDIVNEPEVEPEPEVEAEPEVEEEPEVEPEPEVEAEPEVEPEPEIEAEPEVEVEPEVEEEPEVEAESEIEEMRISVSHEEEGISVAPVPIAAHDASVYGSVTAAGISDNILDSIVGGATSSQETGSGVYVEKATEAKTVETVETVEEDTVPEVMEEFKPEIKEEFKPEIKEEFEPEFKDEFEPEVEEVSEAEEEEEPVSVYDKYKDLSYEVEETGTLAYPKFHNTLFPDIEKKEPEIVNTFDDVAKKEEEKLNERLLEEERMQREAEELLRSLGIKL
ncbi:MAG: hypothetical protein K6E28_08455 [Eubacterium sp.]|nr:hypothetical protein [Eubacterium sp.]